jgi:hypothetical protein
MTVDEASALVRLRCEQRLGHLGEIRMLVNSWDVGIALSMGTWPRLLVSVDPRDVIADPVGMADEICDALEERVQSAP